MRVEAVRVEERGEEVSATFQSTEEEQSSECRQYVSNHVVVHHVSEEKNKRGRGDSDPIVLKQRNSTLLSNVCDATPAVLCCVCSAGGAYLAYSSSLFKSW